MKKSSKVQNYRMICPHPSLRYLCHYCGLSAPYLDHSPPVKMAHEFDEEGINYNPVKVPCCKECLKLSEDCKNWRLPDRVHEIKKMLVKKYKRYLVQEQWEKSEIDELDYSLSTLVRAHCEYKGLIENRIIWGFEEKETAYSVLGVNNV